jgi:hypothetical protein
MWMSVDNLSQKMFTITVAFQKNPYPLNLSQAQIESWVAFQNKVPVSEPHAKLLFTAPKFGGGWEGIVLS